jgi:hypothetical protein
MFKELTQQKIISLCLLLLIAALPFLAIKVSLINIVIGKVIFMVSGFLALFSLVNSRYKFRKKDILILVLILIYSLLGLSHVNKLEDLIWDFLPSFLVFLFSFFILKSYINHNDTNFIKLVSYILIFYSFDVVFQYFTGENVIGWDQNTSNRYWGFFYYGAPTAGIFISMLFYIPWFVFTGAKRVAIYVLLIAALLMTNDRGPILQILTISVVYGLIYKPKVTTFLILLAVALLYSIDLPNRVELVRQLAVDVVFGNEFIYHEDDIYSINGYLDKYILIINNWFSLSNATNFIVGAGIGGSELILKELIGLSRPHSHLLEFFITFGIFTGSFLIFLLVRFVASMKQCGIILAPIVFPFSFSSIYSFNWFILAVIAVICIQLLQNNKKVYS